MTSRFRAKSSLNAPCTKFAMVTGMQLRELHISHRCVRAYSVNRDTALIDRRRLARAIRREYRSIQREIDELGAAIPPVRR
jgi:hypothetical protein